MERTENLPGFARQCSGTSPRIEDTSLPVPRETDCSVRRKPASPECLLPRLSSLILLSPPPRITVITLIISNRHFRTPTMTGHWATCWMCLLSFRLDHKPSLKQASLLCPFYRLANRDFQVPIGKILILKNPSSKILKIRERIYGSRIFQSLNKDFS